MSCVISPDGEYRTASRSNDELFYNGLHFTVTPECYGIHGTYALWLCMIKQLYGRKDQYFIWMGSSCGIRNGIKTVTQACTPHESEDPTAQLSH
jgi:hypothetical protein